MIIPPNNIELEQTVLGALLVFPKALADVGDMLTEADFYSQHNRTVYAAIVALDLAGDPIDLMTVSNYLREAGALDEVGGMSALGAMARDALQPSNIRSYANTIRDMAIERQLLESAYSAQQIIAERGETSEKISAVQKLFMDVGSRSGQGPRKAAQILPGVLDELERLSNSDSEIVGLPTGFLDLDRKTAGLQGGDLIVLAGRPSMGKTAIGMNIAEHAAVNLGLPTLVFSLEMPAEQLIKRATSSLSGVPMERVRSPRQMRDEDWPRLVKATGEINAAPLYIDDQGGLTPAEMFSRARRVKQQHGLRLVVVDYLQLMRGSDTRRNDNRTAEISEISRSLKQMARDLSVPVIALSQLNRSLEARQNKRPIMSDLRESGAIEQDADVILFAYRDEVYHEASDTDPRRGVAELIIGKQRNGPIGKLLLTFQGECVRFRDIDEVSARRYHQADQPKQRYAKAGFDDL